MTNRSNEKGLQLYLSRRWELMQTGLLVFTWVVLVGERQTRSMFIPLVPRRFSAGNSSGTGWTNVGSSRSSNTSLIRWHQLDSHQSQCRLHHRQSSRSLETTNREGISPDAHRFGFLHGFSRSVGGQTTLPIEHLSFSSKWSSQRH